MLNHSADGETTEDEEYPEGPIKPPATEPLDEDSPSDSEYHKPVRHSKDEPLTTAFSLNKRRNKPIAVAAPIRVELTMRSSRHAAAVSSTPIDSHGHREVRSSIRMRLT